MFRVQEVVTVHPENPDRKVPEVPTVTMVSQDSPDNVENLDLLVWEVDPVYKDLQVQPVWTDQREMVEYKDYKVQCDTKQFL